MTLPVEKAFDNFYIQFYGKRWKSIKSALLAPSKYLAWINPEVKTNIEELSSIFYGCGYSDGGFPPPSQMRPLGLKNYYLLDASSVVAARALRVENAHRILDLCAAPGGKTLVLQENLQTKAILTANERSKTRRLRLKKVLEEYLSEERLQNIRVTSYDAQKWCLHEKESYDAILLDVPCSSERHLLRQKKEIKKWTSKRSQILAKRQWAMLSSALRALEPKGRLVYSTCSISPFENDHVIERLKEKYKDIVEVITSTYPIGEPTQHGWQILPDQEGWGPLYFSVIYKKDSMLKELK